MGTIIIEEASYDDINTAFNNLSLNHNIIKEITNSENESRDSVICTFKPLVLSAIDISRDKKKRPDVDSIYSHIIKTQASNAVRVLSESVVTSLIKENLMFNKKNCIRFWFLLLKQCTPERRNYV